MSKPIKKWIYVGAALTALLQTGFLFASIESRANIFRSGKEITVATNRVDPRDLLRGDYVIVGYDFSTISKSMIEGENPAGNRNVYVALKEDKDGLWRVDRASFIPFNNLPDDEVQLRGVSTYQINSGRNQTIFLRYGIERYYVPEGEGRVLESNIANDKVTAVLSVAKNGQVQIKGMQLDGNMIYSEPLY